MNYQVDWLPSAVNRLAEIYMNALDKRAVTEASHRIDVMLAVNAEQVGTDFQNDRVLMVPPLIVSFSVDVPDHHVEVLKVERCLSGNGQIC